MRIDELPPEKRGFGMVFQNYALFPHMSVRDNVGFGLRMRGAPRAEIEGRVARALELVQLRGHEEKLPGQLSGGQQQRVAIARAIVIEPPLVLMDEPLSNLDARLRLEMRAEIRRIHRSLGRATIYVTHDQEEALSMADRIVVMRDGRVRQVGAPAEIYGEPADLAVARFMGYRNELAANVEHVAGKELLLSGGLRGHAMAPLREGERVRAAIRPEDLVLGDGPLRGRVDNIEYGGRDSLIDVVLADGTRLHVRSAARARLGDEVSIGFTPQRLLVYPAP
jgi:putative spermidine/putrescine transport system ATP-binding protein